MDMQACPLGSLLAGRKKSRFRTLYVKGNGSQEKEAHMKAIGLIELSNCTDAIEALDIMLKTADVRMLTWEKKLGGRLVTIIIQGEVSAVTEAVEAAKHRAVGKIVASAVIANPHEETMKLVAVSAKKYPKLQQADNIKNFE